MREVTPLPTHGAVFFDERDHGRSLRVSFHEDERVFVLSMWRYDSCLSTFRLPAEKTPEFVSSLVEGLVGAHPSQAGTWESA